MVRVVLSVLLLSLLAIGFASASPRRRQPMAGRMQEIADEAMGAAQDVHGDAEDETPAPQPDTVSEESDAVEEETPSPQPEEGSEEPDAVEDEAPVPQPEEVSLGQASPDWFGAWKDKAKAWKDQAEGLLRDPMSNDSFKKAKENVESGHSIASNSYNEAMEKMKASMKDFGDKMKEAQDKAKEASEGGDEAKDDTVAPTPKPDGAGLLQNGTTSKFFYVTTELDDSAVLAMLQAGVKKAEAIKVPENIVIVDASGLVLGKITMTGAKFLSQQTAMSKALTAASGGGCSGPLPESVRDEVLISTHGDLTGLQGGLPIKKDGVLIGGIGVGSGAPTDDLAVGHAALEAIGADPMEGGNCDA